MASLPRPARTSLNPPSGPLPSLPTTTPRRSIGAAPDTPDSDRPSTPSSLRQPASTRTFSSSSIPTTGSVPTTNGTSTPAASDLAETRSIDSTASAPVRPVRKTISQGSLNRFAVQQRSPNLPQSTYAAGPTARAPFRTSSMGPGVRSISSGSSLRMSGPVAGAMKSRESLTESIASVNSSMSRNTTPRTADGATDDRTQPSRGRMSTVSRADKDKGNVIVSVRVRPEAPGADTSKTESEWSVESRRAAVTYNGKEGGEYLYDNVFSTHDKNAKVYDASAKRLVRRVMEGYHGTVFAYGMTGTGKTFSMQGTAKSPGVIPLAITDIFSFIRETPSREFLLRVSYLEIYNEKIYDLLSAPTGPVAAGAPPPEEIKLREDSKRGVYATPLKEEIVQSPTQLLRVIARGDHARRTSSTQYNARSSRSHAVVQIVVESRERVPGSGAMDSSRQAVVPGGVRVSTLSLIDLAGSERAAESKERRTEGAHINKSLLTLGTVISKLSGNKDKQGNPTDRDGKHLPYRDSKLTRLLQSALAGNSLISILCTIQLGPTGTAATATTHVGETLNTLKFASRAKNNIVSHAKKAEEAHVGDASSRALLDRYRVEIGELRKQLESQKMEKQKAKDDEEEKAKELEAEARHEEQMLEMQLARTALKERIEHLNRLILSSKSIGVNSLYGGGGRTSSSLSLRAARSSMMSNGDYMHSIRSSTSTQTLNRTPMERMSTASFATTIADQASQGSPLLDGDHDLEEEETYGEDATMTDRVRALQADLADRNRYIATLEKRLLQARRNSRSRVSMTFASQRIPLTGADEDIGGTTALLREKDNEIAGLRATIEDQARSIAVLRTFVRKRDTAAGRTSTAASIASLAEVAASSNPSARTHSAKTSFDSGNKRGSASTTTSAFSAKGLNGRTSTISNSAASTTNANTNGVSGVSARRGSRARSSRNGSKSHSTDDVTRILDEMIQEGSGRNLGRTSNDSSRGMTNGDSHDAVNFPISRTQSLTQTSNNPPFYNPSRTTAAASVPASPIHARGPSDDPGSTTATSTPRAARTDRSDYNNSITTSNGTSNGTGSNRDTLRFSSLSLVTNGGRFPIPPSTTPTPSTASTSMSARAPPASAMAMASATANTITDSIGYPGIVPASSMAGGRFSPSSPGAATLQGTLQKRGFPLSASGNGTAL